MEIVKILNDYVKTPLQKDLCTYLSQQLDTTICREKIKNKDFMIKYIQPINDLIIHTTSVAGADVRRMLY